MSITYYLTHNTAVRVLSIIMVVMVLMSCFIVSPADAVAGEVGIALIAAILSAFGLSVSSSGAVLGFKENISDLMEEFGTAVHNKASWLRDQFNARISFWTFGVLKIGSILVDAIKEFISWLKSEKELSPTNQIVYGQTEGDTVIINGVEYPTIKYSNARIINGYLQYNYEGGAVFKYYNNDSVNVVDRMKKYQSMFPGLSLHIEFTSNYGQSYPYFKFVRYSGNNYYGESGFYPTAIRGVRYSEYSINVVIVDVDDKQYAVLTGLQSELTIGTRVQTVIGTNMRYLLTDNPTYEYGAPGIVINDDNIDLSYLDNDDDSTKDVYFTPALPDIVDADLSNIDGISDAVERQLDINKEKTGIAEIAGNMDITSDLEPGSGGAGNVPPIVIPSHGWFKSIWHYVVKALQDSAEGIAFIVRLMQETIPPEILNLCWASAVLLITFGIINKFLK